MSIETYTDSDGNTYHIVHPAGFSYYDAPVESVNKLNPSNSFVAGDVLTVLSNTASGEFWSKKFNTTYGTRDAVVYADSASGVTSVSVQRVPRISVSSAMGGSVNTLNEPRIGAATMGDTSTPSFKYNNWSRELVFNVVRMLSISKPSSEGWGNLSRIYGYINGGGSTAYTILLGTASANSVYWIAGYCCLFAPVGTTTAYVHQSIFHDGDKLFTGNLSKTSSALSIHAAVSGSAPSLGSNIFTSYDKAFVSGTINATCNILLGVCVGIDGTLSPPTYSYFKPAGMYEGGNAESILAAVGGHDVCLLSQISMQSSYPFATPPGVRPGSTGIRSGYHVISVVNNSGTTKTILAAPIYGTKNYAMVDDMAYDPVLPAPFNDCRIIWSYSPGREGYNFEFGAVAGLFPALATRTDTTSAPYSGMVPANKTKPARFASASYRYGGMGSVRHPQVLESRSTPYVWESYGADAPANVAFDYRVRGAQIPSGTAVYNGPDNLSDFQWRWESYDYTIGHMAPLTSYVSGSGSGTSWSATVTPPAVTGQNVYNVLCRIRGTLDPDTGFPTYEAVFVPTSIPLGVWPYDIVKFSNATDSGGEWSGNAGWIWPDEPAGPTVTWSNEPSMSLVGNVLTITSSASISATVTPSANFNNENLPWGTRILTPSIFIAFDDGTMAIPQSASGLVAYNSQDISPYPIKLPGSFNWGNTFTTTIFKSLKGSKSITVKLYYTAIINSAFNTYSLSGYAVPRVISQTFTLT
jgi:hypothetical protein